MTFSDVEDKSTVWPPPITKHPRKYRQQNVFEDSSGSLCADIFILDLNSTKFKKCICYIQERDGLGHQASPFNILVLWQCWLDGNGGHDLQCGNGWQGGNWGKFKAIDILY